MAPADQGEIRRLLDAVARLCASLQGQTVLLALTEKASDLFEKPLQKARIKNLRLLSISAPHEDFKAANPAVVCLVASDPRDRYLAYGQLEWLKATECPVLYDLPEYWMAHGPPTPAHVGISGEGMFWVAAQYIATVRPRPGAYCEFGVFDGRSFSTAYHALKEHCNTFYAFDSFSGIAGAMEAEGTHFRDGQYSASLPTFMFNMRAAGLDMNRLKTVQGFFSETLVGKTPKDLGMDSISIAHIDTDVYEPALQALEFLSPALADGALLIFDDYDHLAASNEKGERKAMREWLQNHPELEVEPYRTYAAFGRAFIVHRKASV